jgi:hypothetical protein
MSGQLLEARLGATATSGGSSDKDMKLWQVMPTGQSPAIPETTVTPVAK